MSTDPASMYLWRKMSDIQRKEILVERRLEKRPSHSLPHCESDETTLYLVTATCFNHLPIIGHSPARMADFENRLVKTIDENSRSLFAWIVLPNHYHFLVETASITSLLKTLGLLHGRTSFQWNGEEKKRGRQVWCNAAETAMKSERHFYATFNYVMHNAVRHGYVTQWTDWPYCNAIDYLERVGRERAIEMWREYPLYDFGKDWDPPEL